MSIAYQTRTSVGPAVRAAILADLKTLTYPGSAPWCESVGFYDTEPEMRGEHKMFRMYTEPPSGPQQPIDFRDDSLMAALDLAAVFSWLHHIAQIHDLTWYIAMEEHEFGTINRHPLGTDIGGFAEAMARDGGAANLDDARRRASDIRAKYGIA